MKWSPDDFKSIDDVEALIADNPHEVHNLEYKGSGLNRKKPDFTHELAQAVSAFANSDGGMVVWGVSEGSQHPATMDPVEEGLDRQRLGHILSSGLSPALDPRTIEVRSIPCDAKWVHLIFVLESYGPPHMLISDGPNQGKYFARGFNGVRLMLDYEVRSMLGRRQKPELAIEVGPVSISDRYPGGVGLRIDASLGNQGHAAGNNVAVLFTMPRSHLGLTWSNRHLMEPRAGSDASVEHFVWRVPFPVLPGLCEHQGFVLMLGKRGQDDGVAEVIFRTQVFSEATEPRAQTFHVRKSFGPDEVWTWQEPAVPEAEDDDLAVVAHILRR